MVEYTVNGKKEKISSSTGIKEVLENSRRSLDVRVSFLSSILFYYSLLLSIGIYIYPQVCTNPAILWCSFPIDIFSLTLFVSLGFISLFVHAYFKSQERNRILVVELEQAIQKENKGRGRRRHVVGET